MRRFTLVVFPDERSALRGFHALQQLHREGSVRVFAAAVAARDAAGVLQVIKRSEAAPLGAGLGALIGGLRSEVLAYVVGDLAPGDFAVVAELQEQWVTAIDAWAEAVGGRAVCAWWKDLGDATDAAAGGRLGSRRELGHA